MSVVPLNPKFSEARQTVIVGGGASGALSLIGLLKKTSPQVITVFEKSHPFGLGLAYDTGNLRQALNVRAHNMSLLVENPHHFCDWLASNNYSYKSEDFVPRKIYGEYVQATIAEQIKKSESLHQVTLMKDEVIDVCFGDENKKNYLVTLTDKKIDFDQLLLATGNEKPRSFGLPHQSLTLRVIDDPWRFDYSKIQPQQNILIIGTGLTAIDVLLELNHRLKTPITLLSRHGLLPRPHSNEKTDRKINFSGLLEKTSLRDIAKDLRSLLETSEIPWQLVMDQFKPQVQKIWQNLNLSDRRQFLRHAVPYWNVFRHRVPLPLQQEVESLIQSGKIRSLSGRIIEINEQETKLEVKLRARKKTSTEVQSFDYVFNCTGPSGSAADNNPLLKRMTEKGLIQVDPLGLGILTDLHGQCLPNGDRSNLPIYAVGSLLRGQLWEITAIPDLRVQIKSMIERLP